jgi:predicted HAD superfamily hydrolase
MNKLMLMTPKMSSDTLHTAVQALPLPVKGETIMDSIRSANEYQKQLDSLLNMWMNYLAVNYAGSYTFPAVEKMFARAMEKSQHLGYNAVENTFADLAESGALMRKA